MEQIFILLVTINRLLLRSKSQKIIHCIDATSHGGVVMKQGLCNGDVAGNERTCATKFCPFTIHPSPFNWFLILAPAVQSIGRIFHNENYPSGVTHLDVY